MRIKIRSTFYSILLLFIFCSKSQEMSFLNLKNAFKDWYLKSHPITAEKFNQIEDIDDWPDYSKDGLDEYIGDLQRFFIELSQIDRTKLSDELKFEYLVLWSYLKNRIHIENKIKIYKYDLKFWSSLIEDGLNNLNLECGTLTYREENILKKRLLKIENLTKQIIFQYTYPIETLKDRGEKQIINLKSKMFSFLEECKSDSNIFNRWNSLIINSSEKIDYLLQQIDEMDLTNNFDISENIWQTSYEIYFGQLIEELIDREYLNKEIDNLENLMFKTALPLYLSKYDEPIWVSRSDTILVIESVFNDLEIKNVNGLEIVEKTKEIIELLTEEFKDEYFFDFKSIEFDFLTADSSLIFKSEYQSHYNNGYSANFYIPNILDSTYLINDTMLEYQIINQIFPGRLNLQIQNSRSSKLLKMIVDQNFIRGWNIYVQDLIHKSDYFFKNPYLLLLIYENKLASLLKLKYYFKNTSQKDYKLDSDLIFSDIIKKELNSHYLNPYITFDYMIFQEILELKKIFHAKFDDDINKFNSFISKDGSHFIYARQNILN